MNVSEWFPGITLCCLCYFTSNRLSILFMKLHTELTHIWQSQPFSLKFSYRCIWKFRKFYLNTSKTCKIVRAQFLRKPVSKQLIINTRLALFNEQLNLQHNRSSRERNLRVEFEMLITWQSISVLSLVQIKRFVANYALKFNYTT